MPTIEQSRLSNLDLEGYSPSAPPSTTLMTAPVTTTEPPRNNVLRCPLPPLWQASPDSLRQFYLNGQVPQFRLMTPLNPTVSSGSSSSGSGAISGPTGSTGSGGSSSSSSSLAVAQAIVRTPMIQPGNAFSGSISLSNSFQLLTLGASAACEVRLYGTAAAQASDLARGLDVPPAAGTVQNLISDVALDSSPYQWAYQNRIGANADSPQSPNVYVTVLNIGSGPASYTITLAYVPLES